jgi:hypothetical protein
LKFVFRTKAIELRSLSFTFSRAEHSDEALDILDVLSRCLLAILLSHQSRDRGLRFSSKEPEASVTIGFRRRRRFHAGTRQEAPDAGNRE